MPPIIRAKCAVLLSEIFPSSSRLLDQFDEAAVLFDAIDPTSACAELTAMVRAALDADPRLPYPDLHAAAVLAFPHMDEASLMIRVCRLYQMHLARTEKECPYKPAQHRSPR